jgi:mannose-6-phosphate isomerase-like protein (cupin superfamily)
MPQLTADSTGRRNPLPTFIRGGKMMRVCILVLAAVYVTACGVRDEEPHFVRLGPDPLPDESFEKPPEKPLQPGSLLIYPENMTSFYDHPGEAGFFAFGDEYGFDSLSFVITETHPHGGPPLHTHSVEEAHVLLSGTMEYVIGEQKFRASAIYRTRAGQCAPCLRECRRFAFEPHWNFADNGAGLSAVRPKSVDRSG